MLSKNLAHAATSSIAHHGTADFSRCDYADTYFFIGIRRSSNCQRDQQTSGCDSVFSQLIEFRRLSQTTGFREGELIRHGATSNRARAKLQILGSARLDWGAVAAATWSRQPCRDELYYRIRSLRKLLPASGRQQQASSLCSPDNGAVTRTRTFGSPRDSMHRSSR